MISRNDLLSSLRFIIFATVVALFTGTFSTPSFAQNVDADVPVIGAQVFIEPGQSAEDIDAWFRILKENGLKACRIRMFEVYMHKADGSWDYSLFDLAFKSAERHGIKVFATIFPACRDNSVGGFKFPESEQHFQNISDCIRNMVTHFRQFSSMYAWVLQNEPGTGGYLPDTEFTRTRFAEWKKNQPVPAYASKGYPLLVNFSRDRFLVDYETWFLGWIAQEVQKYDPGRHLHTNNHQIFQNAAEYNFPEWRKFLTTLGASAHASWHFGYFKRSQYDMAMSANCDIIRSGAGEIPFWVTELQGGNNTYSGSKAFCPTQEEITQWLWTSIGAGARGIIFWCLNPRSIGEEAGEWALLDFQNGRSDRFLAASAVASTLQANQKLFAQAKPIDTGINILYAREALWVEKKVQLSSPADMKDYEGRMQGGAMKSALSYYETLAENGVNSNFKEMNEFDWSKADYKGTTIILANQVAVPSRYWDKLDNFVQNGGKMIVDGLTFFYDENMLSLMNTGFPLAKMMGGSLSEVKCTPGDFAIRLSQPELELPVHLWKGYIANTTGKILGSEGGMVLATRNSYGRGETVWIPSLAGLGAWRNQNTQLSAFLRQELAPALSNMPVSFSQQQKAVLMRTLQSGKQFIMVLVNKSTEPRTISLSMKSPLTGKMIFANKGAKLDGTNVLIAPEETMVVVWE